MANNPTTRAQQWARFLETKGWLSSTALPGVVGTVSQAAGVPTGSVVERGSNTNGEFIKFADGTMICWKSALTGLPVTEAVGTGGVFRSDVITWTYPVAFIAAATVTGTVSAGATSFWANGNFTSVSNCAARLYAGISSAAGTAVNFVAIGRWF